MTAVDIERQVVAFAKANYSNPELTLEHAAEVLGTSPRTLNRCLEACKNRWLSILTKERMAAGRKLLTTTDLSMDEIAYSVGYLNLATFRKNYRHCYGESPSKTRKEARSR